MQVSQIHIVHALKHLLPYKELHVLSQLIFCSPNKIMGGYNRRVVRPSVRPDEPMSLICIQPITLTLFEVGFYLFFHINDHNIEATCRVQQLGR